MTSGPPTMYCLDCRYPLDGLESRRCPECGGEFDPDDPLTYRRGLLDPVKLHTTRNQTEAHMLRTALEQHGIPAVVEESAAGIVESAGGSVWVNRIDREAAMVIVRDWTPGSLEDLATSWTCRACGEEIEPQFAICWNCQSPRGD